MVKPLFILWSLLAVAVATIVVMAQLWSWQRQASSQQRVREILAAQLLPFDDAIGSVLQQYSDQLQDELTECDLSDASECSQFDRLPIVQNIVVVDANNQLFYPASLSGRDETSALLLSECLLLLREYGDPRPSAASGQSELAELEQDSTSQKVDDAGQAVQQSIQSRSYAVAPSNRFAPSRNQLSQESVPTNQSLSEQPAGDEVARNETSSDGISSPINSNGQLANETQIGITETVDSFAPKVGWITWYHRRGIVLGFLGVQSNGYRCMILLPRARWMSDIVADLPGSGGDRRGSQDGLSFNRALKQLVDIEGKVIYQWGTSPPENFPADATSDAELPVVPPLEGWRLRIFADEELRTQLAGDNVAWPLWLGVGGLSIALFFSGLFVTVHLGRQVRDAQKRVSFVNQVSHELRTPLTNIRMYADILEHRLESAGEDAQTLEKVHVIQNESRRLSRLITNVLVFARGATTKPKLTRRLLDVKQVVSDVIDTFRPRLDESKMIVELEQNVAGPVMIDPDAFEQILVNLIGNAEKYAVGGGWLKIHTQLDGDWLTLTVSDNGPGIPPRHRDAIFRPFFRCSDKLEDPAGTGIGLTIVRELAERHGGDCTLMPSESGAVFRCRLRCSNENGSASYINKGAQ